MDPTSFDRLSRTFAAALSRRRLAGLLRGLPFAVLLPVLAEEATEAKKKKKKKKGKPATPVSPSSPPGSPSSPPGSPPVSPPPPPNPCPQAAAPRFCASANAGAGVCLPACAAGKVFDAASCTCVCAQEETCCSCVRTSDSNILCFRGVADRGACNSECAADGGSDVKFAGGPGLSARCASDSNACEETCVTDTVCGTANECDGITSCAGGGGNCTQPLGGGPTRCATGVSVVGCGCTSHQYCVDRNGPGAFCVDASRCGDISCPGGATTFCAQSD